MLGGSDAQLAPALADALPALLALLLGGGAIAGAAATGRQPRKETVMTDTDWQTLARKALEKEDEPIKARPSDITRIGAPVVALLGTVIAALLGTQFEFDPKQGETVIAAAVIASTSILGVLLVYAADFRTRGRAATARLDALTRLARQELVGKAQAAEALQATLTLREEELLAARTELKVCQGVNHAALHSKLEACDGELKAAKDELATRIHNGAHEPRNGAAPTTVEDMTRTVTNTTALVEAALRLLNLRGTPPGQPPPPG
jgi:hypothetical protein